MSTCIQIRHIDGLRLRQRTMREVPDSKFRPEKEGDAPPMVKAWKFPEDGGEVPQDTDARTHVPAGTYSPYVATNIRDLVIESRGAQTNVTFRNANVRQTLRVTQQELGKDKKWRPSGSQMVPANTWGGCVVGNGNRAIIQELPT